MERGWPSGSHLTTKDVCIYAVCSFQLAQNRSLQILHNCKVAVFIAHTFLVPRDFFALPHILFLEEWPIFASIVASSFLKRNLNRPRPVVSFCTVLCKQIHVLEITKGLRISYKCLKWMNIMETFNIAQTIVNYICLMAGKL